jgi:alcohol dehydrogenase
MVSNPAAFAYEQAAPIFCAGYTVYSGLRWANPKPHERVAVLGIGGLGHLAVQSERPSGSSVLTSAYIGMNSAWRMLVTAGFT